MITDRDIREHYVLPSIAGEFEDDFDVDMIMDDLLAKYPLTEWRLVGQQYHHPALDEDPALYWDLVQRNVKPEVE